MTGYGSGDSARSGVRLSVQIVSVNRKHPEARVHLPRELVFLEPAIRNWLRDAVSRGFFTVNVNLEVAADQGRRLVVNHHLVSALRNELAALQADGVGGQLTISDLLHVPDLVRVEGVNTSDELLTELAESATRAAISALNAMRDIEGESLRTDLTVRTACLAGLLTQIGPLAAESVSQYRDRLSLRIQELLGETKLDEERLCREVAIYADRSDISEELTRIASHLEQFSAAIADPEPAGRRMEFITQELGREINTVGSKTIHAGISLLVVSFKSELDRIREQVQNVE